MWVTVVLALVVVPFFGYPLVGLYGNQVIVGGSRGTCECAVCVCVCVCRCLPAVGCSLEVTENAGVCCV